MDWKVGDATGADAAFARAAHIVSLDLDNHRVTTNPIEPRGSVGMFDPASGRYTLHISSQSIHANRNHAARALGVEPKDVRFIAPDVGGGFGAKNFIYVEHVLVAWAARKVGRPVKWIATRSEVFLADHPSRDMQAKASLALDADGQVPRAARSQRRQCRRLSRGRRRRRADLSVRPPAGHGLSPARRSRCMCAWC